MNEFERVRSYLTDLQDRICGAVETADGQARFTEDLWQRAEGGGGRTRILRDGAVFEQAGIGFSDVSGTRLPPSVADPTGRAYRSGTDYELADALGGFLRTGLKPALLGYKKTAGQLVAEFFQVVRKLIEICGDKMIFDLVKTLEPECRNLI